MGKLMINTKTVAKLCAISLRRVQAKIKSGHYKTLKLCECGENWVISKDDEEIKRKVKV